MSSDGRASAAKRGYDLKWRRIRASYLRRHPVCETPGCDAPATDVDHVDGRGPLGDNRDTNLRSQCHPCHSRKTAKEDGGFGRRDPRRRQPEAHPGFITGA